VLYLFVGNSRFASNLLVHKLVTSFKW